MASYLKNGRKCHSEVLAMADSSDEECSVSVKDDFGSESRDQATMHVDSCDSDGQNRMSDEILSDQSLPYGYLTEDDERDVIGMGGCVEERPNLVKPDLNSELASWAVKHNCTRACVNDLLTILRSQGHCLPKDNRALLQTPSSVNIIEKCGGQYRYFGIGDGVLKVVPRNKLLVNDAVKLDVNIDGLPLFKSTSSDLWPILGKIGATKPFIIALFYGKRKPNLIDLFLEDFLNEHKCIKENGLQLEDMKINVTIRSFICDATARAFVKCIVNHNGYYSCERCTTKGSWNGRVVFNDQDEHQERTNDSFKKMDYKSHQ
eukprot:gene12558-13844_t